MTAVRNFQVGSGAAVKPNQRAATRGGATAAMTGLPGPSSPAPNLPSGGPSLSGPPQYGGARPEGNGNDQPGVWGQFQKDFSKTVTGGGNSVGLDKGAEGLYGFGAGVMSDAGQKLGFGDRKQQELGNKGEELANQQFGETQGVYGKMNEADKNYLGDVTGTHSAYEKQRDAAIGKYDEQLGHLSDEAASQASDARKTYTGTVAPALKTAMGNATREAANAMTLNQAADPNNQVQQRYRDLYNKEAERNRGIMDTEGEAANKRMANEGQLENIRREMLGNRQQQQYEQLGQGYRTQGLQDAGVLSALGAQATAGQFAGMPIGGAQLAAVNAQNQRGASEAYARGAKRMQDLKEQGLAENIKQQNLGADAGAGYRKEGLFRQSDIRQNARLDEATQRGQGITAGRTESGSQYDRGETARDRARQATSDVSEGQRLANEESRRFRGEIGDIGSERMGMEVGRARDTRDLATDRANIAQGGRYGASNRELAGINQRYGYAQQRISDQIERENQIQAGKVNALGTGAQAISTLVGGVMGGPGGAAAGSQGGGVAKQQMNDMAGNTGTYTGPGAAAGADAGYRAGGYGRTRRGYYGDAGNYDSYGGTA